MERLTVVTSAYNEEAGISEFLAELYKLKVPGAKVDFVAVNNGSLDRTGALLNSFARGKPNFRALHNKAPTLGLDAGLMRGFAAAKGDYIAIIRSDWQEDPSDIAKLFLKMKEEGLDCIVGWRRERKDPPIRLFYSRAFNFLVWLFYRIPVPDINGAPKILKSSYIKGYTLRSHRFIIDLELLWQIKKARGKIGYMEAKHFARRRGPGTVKFQDVVRMALDFFDYTFFGRN